MVIKHVLIMSNSAAKMVQGHSIYRKYCQQLIHLIEYNSFFATFCNRLEADLFGRAWGDSPYHLLLFNCIVLYRLEE